MAQLTFYSYRQFIFSVDCSRQMATVRVFTPSPFVSPVRAVGIGGNVCSLRVLYAVRNATRPLCYSGDDVVRRVNNYTLINNNTARDYFL